MNGVAQQVALAVQNEQLNLEMVTANDLNAKFNSRARFRRPSCLPHSLYPGLGIDLRWKPAREVGGDFTTCWI